MLQKFVEILWFDKLVGSRVASKVAGFFVIWYKRMMVYFRLGNGYGVACRIENRNRRKATVKVWRNPHLRILPMQWSRYFITITNVCFRGISDTSALIGLQISKNLSIGCDQVLGYFELCIMYMQSSQLGFDIQENNNNLLLKFFF